MRILKYFLIFGLASIILSVIIFIISGGHTLFLLGGIPLVFGGFWSFRGNQKTEE